MSVTFCPTCGNLLLVDLVHGDNSLCCQTCPYIYTLDRPLIKNVTLKKKEVDDVLGGEEAWANVQKTDATCPKCGYHQAYFMEIQIRSADEPATLFFKCVQCAAQWREG